MKKSSLYFFIALITSLVFVFSIDIFYDKLTDNLSIEAKNIIDKNIKQVEVEMKNDDGLKQELKGIEKSFKNFLRGNSSSNKLEDDTKKSLKILEKKGKELFNQDEFDEDLKQSVKNSVKQTVVNNLGLFLIILISLSSALGCLFMSIKNLVFVIFKGKENGI